jgi:hypothetical protein
MRYARLPLVFLLLLLAFPVSINRAVLLGDGNGDGVVDGKDYLIWQTHYGQAVTCGASCGDFNGDGTVNGADYLVWAGNYRRTETTPTRTPTPQRTTTPSRTPTPGTGTIASPTPTPLGINSRWGIYPNCVAPAMPVEAQTWWTETANPQPGDEIPFGRHIHAAACMPHARDTDGRLVNVGGTFDIVRVLLLHNTNLKLTKGDNGFPDLGSGAEFPVTFNPALTCPNRAINCTFYSTNRIDTTAMPDGLHELRWRIQGTHPDLSDTTEFISFATKIYTKNGRTLNSTATNPAPRARGWYEGIDYDSVEISNYNTLYRGRTDITVPVVSGAVALSMNHTQSVGGTIRSRLYLDPNFHAGSTGTVLYDKPGLFQGTYTLDTARIPNGRHVLVAQTEHTAANGIHSGLLKLFIDIQN